MEPKRDQERMMDQQYEVVQMKFFAPPDQRRRVGHIGVAVEIKPSTLDQSYDGIRLRFDDGATYMYSRDELELVSV